MGELGEERPVRPITKNFKVSKMEADQVAVLFRVCVWSKTRTFLFLLFIFIFNPVAHTIAIF